MPILNTADKLYLGSTVVDAMYAGASKVYPAFSPITITGLSLWLDAADYTSGNWPDKSGLHQTSTVVGTPAMIISPDQLNGHQLVRFKVNEGRLRGTMPGVTTDYTIIYLTRLWGPNLGRGFGAQYPPANFLVGFHSSGYDCMYDNGWVYQGAVTPANAWKMYEADGNSAAVRSRFYLDGVLKGTQATGNSQGMSNSTWALSGYDAVGAQETTDMDVAEVLVWNRQLSAAERAQAEDYLRAKWGLT